MAYNNRRCCSPLGLATQRAAIHQIHLYELPPSATVSKTPPHLIAVSILDFCGSGGIRTPEAEAPDLQSGPNYRIRNTPLKIPTHIPESAYVIQNIPLLHRDPTGLTCVTPIPIPWYFLWCRTESNRRHADLQSAALPTELLHHFIVTNYFYH